MSTSHDIIKSPDAIVEKPAVIEESPLGKVEKTIERLKAKSAEQWERANSLMRKSADLKYKDYSAESTPEELAEANKLGEESSRLFKYSDTLDEKIKELRTSIENGSVEVAAVENPTENITTSEPSTDLAPEKPIEELTLAELEDAVAIIEKRQEVLYKEVSIANIKMIEAYKKVPADEVEIARTEEEYNSLLYEGNDLRDKNTKISTLINNRGYEKTIVDRKAEELRIKTEKENSPEVVAERELNQLAGKSENSVRALGNFINNPFNETRDFETTIKEVDSFIKTCEDISKFLLKTSPEIVQKLGSGNMWSMKDNAKKLLDSSQKIITERIKKETANIHLDNWHTKINRYGSSGPTEEGRKQAESNRQRYDGVLARLESNKKTLATALER